MKVMTFNTQHCLNYRERVIDFEVMAKAILDCDADVVGLNEMRGAGIHPEYTDQVGELARLTGMPYHYFAPALTFSGKGPYGNGIISRIPFVKVENVPIPDPFPKNEGGYYETRCVLRAELENGITVLASHFGLNPGEQKNAVKTVLAAAPESRCILMGDFNLRPESPILGEIRSRMKDAAECFSEPQLSFPSDAPTCKIDYIFVSPDLKVESAEIPAIVASDHRPHIATVTF